MIQDQKSQEKSRNVILGAESKSLQEPEVVLKLLSGQEVVGLNYFGRQDVRKK